MYIKVHVTAGARREMFEQTSTDLCTVSVTEPAEGGAANRRVLALLKAHFGTTDIRLISGHTSPSKIFSVEKN